MRGERKPRTLTFERHATYQLVRGEQTVGTERVVAKTYSDNTIEFEVYSRQVYPGEAEVEQRSELVVEEESYFPRQYNKLKEMRAPKGGFTHEVSITMYANLAEVRTKLETSETTRRVVLPTGAAFIETGMVHHLEQLLFWYDREVGGRQNFDVFEVDQTRPEPATLRKVEDTTVAVVDEEVSAEKFVLEREKIDTTFYVDAKGRIVRVEYFGQYFELTDWAEKEAGETE